jgi:hypothetical protein
MLWLNHPKFVRVRDGILDVFSRNEYRFRRTPNVLFLCGGHGSKPRERLAQYIRKRRSDTLVFYAETVWATISKIEQMSALEMEAKLASISDIVMIFIERRFASKIVANSRQAISHRPIIRRNWPRPLDRQGLQLSPEHLG